MATRKVQFTVRLEGRDQRMEVDIEDTNSDGTVSDDEVRAQAETRLREAIDRNADHPPGRVEVLSFRVDDNNDTRFNEPARTFSTNPLVFDVNRVRRTVASLDTAGLTNPAGGLAAIPYDSDGQPNQSGNESLTFARNLFRLYNVDFDAWARNPGNVTIPAGLEAIIQSGHRRATFAGTDGSAPVSSVLNDARAEITRLQSDPTAAGGAQALTAPSVFNMDITDIDRRIRRLQQQLAELEMKLRMGLIDVVDAHSQFMNIEAQIMALIGAIATVRHTAQLQTKIDQLRANTDRTATSLAGGRPSGQQSADIERNRADTQLITNDMSALNRSLQTILDSVTDMSRKADEAVSWRRGIVTRAGA